MISSSRGIIPEEITKSLLEYIELVYRITSDLRRGILLLNDVRVGEAMKVLSDGIRTDTRADEIRRRILFRIDEVIEDSNVKEALARLIRRFDLIAEQTKEAARYLTIIPYLEIPFDIRERIEEMSRLAAESIDLLVNAVKALIEGDNKKALSQATKVEELEERGDEVNMVTRRLLLDYGEKAPNPALIVLLRDFIEALENIIDFAEDAADYVRLLALKF